MSRKTWKDYFHFSKAERSGVYIVISLILFMASLNFIIPRLLTQNEADFSEFENDIASLKEIEKLSTERSKQLFDFDELTTPNYSLFEFDPNQVSREQLEKLGVKSYVINNLLKYRAKGGQFRKKEDLKKIFGFDLDTYKRLQPYIVIKAKNVSEHIDNESTAANKNKSNLQIDINSSTAEEFQQIKGIGETYSNRIVDYREQVGGFYRIEQIAEVFGIDSSLYQSIEHQLIIQEVELKQISLNFASINDLKNHPYVDYKLARKIYDERVQNGPYQSMDTFLERCVIEESLAVKITPYLKLWD